MIQFDRMQLQAVRALLEQEKANGNFLATYPVQNTPLEADSLCFFNDSYAALEYCYEQSTDRDKWGVKTVDELREITSEKLKIMKQENFDYLKKQVMFTGFGEALEGQLKNNMEKGLPDFQLTHQHKFGKDEANAVLHFRHADSTGNYYFNSYDLSVKNYKGEEQGSQRFYIGRDNNFTLKEGYNLLSGRCVNKDLVNKNNEVYNAWVKLDFKDTDEHGNFKMKHFTSNYGYNIDEALAKHPVKELQNDDSKDKLLESLKKGNRQQVTFVRDGGEVKGYMEANPQYKTITVYDQNFKRVNQSESNTQDKKQSAKQATKVAQKAAGEKEGAPKPKNKKKVTHKVS